jgi:nitroreductase
MMVSTATEPIVEASSSDQAATIDAIIRSRRSIRRFLDKPVSLDTVRDILSVARHAPSGGNSQPWRCYVVTGQARDRLVHAAVAAYQSAPQELPSEYPFYPSPLPEPQRSRHQRFRQALSDSQGIDRSDKIARARELDRQFMFFDAPVGMIFTIDRRLYQSSFVCYGGFLQTIMLATRARGLDTCPQQIWSRMHHVVRSMIDIPDGEMVVAGMSLGWADMSAPENRFTLERAALEEFVTIIDQ